MLVVDGGGRIVRANPAVLALFGYPEGELLGRPIELLMPSRYREGHVRKRAAWNARPMPRLLGSPLSAVRAVNRSGEEIAVDIALGPVEIDGEPCTIANVRDVRQREKLDEELRYQSTHDALTGLCNRASLDQELARLGRGRRFPVAILVIDIDGLKPVNDGSGHAAGDDLLVRASRLLCAAARGDDVVARIGGDEFVIVLPQTTLETARHVLERLAGSVEAHNVGAAIPVRYSAGVAIANSAEGLPVALREADDRMYAHKRSRRLSG
jgi:diguanylate cyclase (GGDEF)-like protein/PAS domain S-box-containing protein